MLEPCNVNTYRTMADVNANMESTSSSEEDGTEEAEGPNLSDTEVDEAEAEPIKTPAPVKVNFSHVQRVYEVSVFFTRFVHEETSKVNTYRFWIRSIIQRRARQLLVPAAEDAREHFSRMGGRSGMKSKVRIFKCFLYKVM